MSSHTPQERGNNVGMLHIAIAFGASGPLLSDS